MLLFFAGKPYAIQNSGKQKVIESIEIDFIVLLIFEGWGIGRGVLLSLSS